MIKDKGIFKNWHVLIIALSVILLFLIIRNCGVYPLIFPDEYTFSTFSRLIPFSDSKIPGYLYLAIFKVTKICGDGSLECARILNSVFLVSAVTFIYLICKDVAGHKTALLIAVCSALGPINSYTAYFMPESLYYFVFWLFTYLLYRYRQEVIWQRVMVLGAILGLLSLVKPHALFLLPALMAYFFVMPLSGKAHQISRTSMCMYFLAAALLVKFSVGFALAGVNGLCLFGSSYTAAVTGTINSISTAVSTAGVGASPASGLHSYLGVARDVVQNLQGHLLALSLLFSIPVTGLVLNSCSWGASPRNYRFNPIAVYTTLILVNLLAVVVLFATVYVGTEPNEISTRLHARYYNFIFPLFLMVAARQATHADDYDSKLKWRVISALPVGAAILYATYTRMSPYYFSPTDYPELSSIIAKQGHFYIFCGLALVCLAVWIYSSQSGAKFFLYLFVPTFVFVSGAYIFKEVNKRRTPDEYDRAGMFTKNYLTRNDLSKVLIVGSDKYRIYRPLLCLDNPAAAIEVIPLGVPYNALQLPEGKEWALVIGDHPVPDNVFYKISLNGYTLVRFRKPDKLNFRTDSAHGVVASISGLNAYESYVGYSTGKEVLIRFCEPLPERFELSLTAFAIGPNVGRNFVISTGSSTQEFTLGASASERALEISNPEKSNVIKLIVPQPAAMETWGPKIDNTLFGFVLADLRIGSL